ncbi:hypothetical protein AB0N21_06580 [Streptomyces sp. NPDC051080]|uniref:hypothetical protein n=1 Tax=Streptomyces sp. NPDC051080 TaxID=3157222 RepID=UPI0034195523
MDHAVTVGADEGEIAELGVPLPRDMERKDVMALDVPGAAVPVDRLEVETARLAREPSAALKNRSDLLLAQAPVPFTRPASAHKQSPFGRTVVVAEFLVLSRREGLQFARRDALTYEPRGLTHLHRPGKKLVQYRDIPPFSRSPSPGGRQG